MGAVVRFGQSAASAEGGGLLKGRSGWDVVEKHLSSSVVVRLVSEKEKPLSKAVCTTALPCGFSAWTNTEGDSHTRELTNSLASIIHLAELSSYLLLLFTAVLHAIVDCFPSTGTLFGATLFVAIPAFFCSHGAVVTSFSF